MIQYNNTSDEHFNHENRIIKALLTLYLRIVDIVSLKRYEKVEEEMAEESW